MTKKLLIIAIAIMTSFGASAAYAHCSDQDMSNQYPGNAPAAQSRAMGNGSDIVKCWGWDGSTGGNDVKKMMRSECFSLHGDVVNHVPAH